MRIIAGAFIVILLLGMFIWTGRVDLVEASETVYIRADGSIDPSTAPISTSDNVKYTLTGNVRDSIVIEKSDIVLDGGGFALLGNGTGTGLSLTGLANVTIVNANMYNFSQGISMSSSNGSRIIGCNIVGSVSIYVKNSSDNSIAENNFTMATTTGTGFSIGLYYCSNINVSRNVIGANNCLSVISAQSSLYSVIAENTITAYDHGFVGFGVWMRGFSNYTTVYGNYVVGAIWGLVIDDNSIGNDVSENNVTESGSVGIRLRCPNSTINGNIVANGYQGMVLGGSSNNTLRGNVLLNNTYGFGVEGTGLEHFLHDIDASNTVDGKPICYWIGKQNLTVPSDSGYVALVNCTDMTAEDLNLAKNGNGIILAFTSNSTIARNSVAANDKYGIHLWQSFNNTVSENDVSGNAGIGIYLNASSAENVMSNNNVTANQGSGITLDSSSNNSVSGNRIERNAGSGFEVLSSSFSIIDGNDVNENAVSGLTLSQSSNNDLSNNNLTSNGADGILIEWSDNNNITANTATNNSHGIRLSYSYENTLTENRVSESNESGIYLCHSNDNNLTGNNATGNEGLGVVLDESSHNILRSNAMSNNSYNFGVDFTHYQGFVPDVANDVDTSNTVDGKPIYYLIDEQDMTIPSNAGYVALVNCLRITADGLNLAKNGNGLLLVNTSYSSFTNSSVIDNAWDAIELISSQNNTLQGNTADGIALDSSSNSSIIGNNIIPSSGHGILITLSEHNDVIDNNIAGCNYGISIQSSHGISVVGNNITASAYDGIYLSKANSTKISQNRISQNQYGIFTSRATDNDIRENELIENDYGGIVLSAFSDFNNLSRNKVAENGRSGFWYPSGISLYGSSNNSLSENNVTLNHEYGIAVLDESTFNNVTANYLEGNAESGILLDRSWFGYSYGTIVFGNTIMNSTYGVTIGQSSSNTVSENSIISNEYGIRLLSGSANNNICMNNITTNTEYGIWVDSQWNNVSENVLKNNRFGIWLSHSSSNTLRSNTMNNNTYNFGVEGSTRDDLANDVDSSNTVDGKPIYYLVDKEDFAVPLDGGYLALINCTRTSAQDLNLSNNGNGVFLVSTTNATIKNNVVTLNYQGIYLDSTSTQNVMEGNNITANGYGIMQAGSSSNTMINNTIADNAEFGVYLSSSSNNTMAQNLIKNNTWAGLQLYYSHDNTIDENKIINNYQGIALSSSSGNLLRNNNLSGNSFNFGVWGWEPSELTNDADTSNTVDEKPIYYWVDRHDDSIPADAGYVALVNCTNIKAENLVLTNNSQGMLLAYTNGTSISGSTITNNSMGIYSRSSDFNRISSNDISSNNEFGVLFEFSSNSDIQGNNITLNMGGLIIYGLSSNNSLVGNLVTENVIGLGLEETSNNTLFGNTFVSNDVGLYLSRSSGNLIYRNNFNNTNQVYIYDSLSNFWNDDYPQGGNFWSNYNGTDAFSGPYQNETGSDGIGDTPYSIDIFNEDQYPLMSQYVGTHDISITEVNVSKTVVGQGFALNVSVTITNQGNFTENATVTAFANTTAIGSQNVMLAGLESTTLTFTWNTSGSAYGNYTITAYASPVPGETYTEDNGCTDGTVKVGIPGDVDPPDGYVGIDDIFAIATHFGQDPSSPNWNANFDISSDDYVGIDDIFIAASHFGQEE